MEKIDKRGKVCPIPLFHTKRRIESMKPGEEVEVPRWSKEHGHDMVSIEDNEDHFRIVVRKGDNRK